jgi:hypothetical protein
MKPETWVALYAAIIGTSAFLLNLKTWFDSGVKLKLSLVGAAVLVLLAVAAPALAEERRPSPVPQTSSGCPPGYSSSPTSGTCAPIAGNRCRAFPSSGSCPSGYSYSPTSRLCVETACR